MKMHFIRLLLITALIIYISSLSTCFRENHHKQELIVASNYLINSLEVFKDKGYKYPKDNDDFEVTIVERLGDVAQFNYILRYCKWYYHYEDNGYRIYIITDYYRHKQSKLSVMIISDKGIYWKDNYAEATSTIEDIDWSNVNILLYSVVRDQDGKFIELKKI